MAFYDCVRTLYNAANISAMFVSSAVLLDELVRFISVYTIVFHNTSLATDISVEEKWEHRT